MNNIKSESKNSFVDYLSAGRDRLWSGIFLLGLIIVWVWDFYFLNTPARHQIETAFINIILISFLVILIATILAWLYTMAFYFSRGLPKLVANFALNLVRSIPQIIGILIGYVIITALIQTEIIKNDNVIMLTMATVISLFIFPELVDLFLERISHFRRSDFYDAMLVCGIRESHIINREILLRSSISHILNKLISVFGMAIFLQCSIDFIISVGLSTEVSSVNFPVTLGSLLAKIDSKQDILAIGYSLTHWSHFDNLFLEHLQGITVAFLIVFTLLCLYHIGNGYARRHRL